MTKGDAQNKGHNCLRFITQTLVRIGLSVSERREKTHAVYFPERQQQHSRQRKHIPQRMQQSSTVLEKLSGLSAVAPGSRSFMAFAAVLEDVAL
mmetsp:Transcript_18133/g.26919  ORF Transcript_18133/g.26919 Transcript_18133/m.26919 type:complete len:94 (-) Transcript_18133:257-538(-)